MALDKDGRPIPVRIPDPREMVKAAQHGSGEMDALQEQLMIAQRKADDALRAAAEIAERMRLLEQKVDSQLPAKLAEIDQRFSDMMLERLRGFAEQFDGLQRSLMKRAEEIQRREDDLAQAERAQRHAQEVAQQDQPTRK